MCGSLDTRFFIIIFSCMILNFLCAYFWFVDRKKEKLRVREKMMMRKQSLDQLRMRIKMKKRMVKISLKRRERRLQPMLSIRLSWIRQTLLRILVMLLYLLKIYPSLYQEVNTLAILDQMFSECMVALLHPSSTIKISAKLSCLPSQMR